jgi:hypothetical protein
MKQLIDKQQILGFVMVCLTIGSKTCEKNLMFPMIFPTSGAATSIPGNVSGRVNPWNQVMIP